MLFKRATKRSRRREDEQKEGQGRGGFYSRRKEERGDRTGDHLLDL